VCTVLGCLKQPNTVHTMVCCHKSINNEHILGLKLNIPLAIFCQSHYFQLAFLNISLVFR